MKTYTTVQGDMWDRIAYQQCGSENYTDKLMNINSQHIGTYIFPAGVTLNLPDIQETISAKSPPWKKVNG